MSYTYSPEYLKKNGSLKKNYLKKASQWRKLNPLNPLNPSINTTAIQPSRLDELLEDIPYPSYQHMNLDIVNIFAEYLIGDKTNDTMNSLTECESFRNFCVMNKRLCFLDLDFRREYNIPAKIDKCRLMRKTTDLELKFTNSPTNNWLPMNKPVKYNYQQKTDVFVFIRSNYSKYISNYGDKMIFKTKPIIDTINKYNQSRYKLYGVELKLCLDTELSGYNTLFDNRYVEKYSDDINSDSEYIYVYSYIDLIQIFKNIPVFFDTFIIDLRTNYCKSTSYNECENIEKNIQYFIKTLLY